MLGTHGPLFCDVAYPATGPGVIYDPTGATALSALTSGKEVRVHLLNGLYVAAQLRGYVLACRPIAAAAGSGKIMLWLPGLHAQLSGTRQPSVPHH